MKGPFCQGLWLYCRILWPKNFSIKWESIILDSVLIFPSLIVRLFIFLYRLVRATKPDVSLAHGCIFICTLGVTATHHVLSSVIQQNPSASALTRSRVKVVRAWDPTPVRTGCAGRLHYLRREILLWIPCFSDDKPLQVVLVTPMLLSSTHSRKSVTFPMKEF